MPVATRVEGELARVEAVAVADLSALRRCGLKGPAAAEWLAARAIPVPSEANRWLELPGGGVIARLGRTEFFLEDATDGRNVETTRVALADGIDGVYPVARQDTAIALAGRRSGELLRQTCNVDFTRVAADEAVMTQMVGVAVLVVRRDKGASPCYRIWCDPTFARYFWETLRGIAEELGGGAVGTEVLLS